MQLWPSRGGADSAVIDAGGSVCQNAWLALMGIAELARAQAALLADLRPDARVTNLSNLNGLTEAEKRAVQEKLGQTLTGLRVAAQDRRYAHETAEEARRLEAEGPRRGRPKGSANKGGD